MLREHRQLASSRIPSVPSRETAPGARSQGSPSVETTNRETTSRLSSGAAASSAAGEIRPAPSRTIGTTVASSRAKKRSFPRTDRSPISSSLVEVLIWWPREEVGARARNKRNERNETSPIRRRGPFIGG